MSHKLVLQMVISNKNCKQQTYLILSAGSWLQLPMPPPLLSKEPYGVELLCSPLHASRPGLGVVPHHLAVPTEEEMPVFEQTQLNIDLLGPEADNLETQA